MLLISMLFKLSTYLAWGSWCYQTRGSAIMTHWRASTSRLLELLRWNQAGLLRRLSKFWPSARIWSKLWRKKKWSSSLDWEFSTHRSMKSRRLSQILSWTPKSLKLSHWAATRLRRSQSKIWRTWSSCIWLGTQLWRWVEQTTGHNTPGDWSEVVGEQTIDASEKPQFSALMQ